MLGVRVLVTAVEKVRDSPEHLTMIHADALQLALVAKMVKPVLCLLQQRVLHVSKDCMQPRDFLLYFYYGGMCFAAIKEMSKALDMFQVRVRACVCACMCLCVLSACRTLVDDVVICVFRKEMPKLQRIKLTKQS